MAKVAETFNVRDRNDLTIDKLLDIMLDMYQDLATQLNKKPDVYLRNTDGLSSDTFLSNGDININTVTGAVQTLLDHPTQSTVTWSSGGGNASNIVANIYFKWGTAPGVTYFSYNITKTYVGGAFNFSFINPMANENYMIISDYTGYGAANSRPAFVSKTVNGFTAKFTGGIPTNFGFIVLGELA